MRVAPQHFSMRVTLLSAVVTVILFVALAAALAPRLDSGLIREQQQQHHQPEQAAWELGHHRRSELSAPADPMVCPSKPQGMHAQQCNKPTLGGLGPLPCQQQQAFHLVSFLFRVCT